MLITLRCSQCKYFRNSSLSVNNTVDPTSHSFLRHNHTTRAIRLSVLCMKTTSVRSGFRNVSLHQQQYFTRLHSRYTHPDNHNNSYSTGLLVGFGLATNYLIVHPIISFHISAWNIKEAKYTKPVVDGYYDDIMVSYE